MNETKTETGRPVGVLSTHPLVALVRAGATFTNGKLIEWPSQKAQPDAAQ